MQDQEQDDLFLGCGIRENENLISIDIDPSSVLPVKIQSTTSVLLLHTMSTQDLNPIASVLALKEMSLETSYAIVPGSLPTLSNLDDWGRQDIREVARKWPFNLEASYDLAFLEYCEVTPKLPCVSIRNS
jgi:hypothetical protein